MNTGKVIVTAHNADVKVANQLLLHLRDWEFGSEPTWDQFHILHTVQELNKADMEGDIPPLQEFGGNEFAGMALPAVEALMMEKNHSLFLILDDEGVQTQSVVLVQRAIDINDVTGNLYFDEFNKTRIPWSEVTIVAVNLGIANMGFDDFIAQEFEEFTDLGNAKKRERWWDYQRVGDGLPEEMAAKRDAALRELQKLDLA